MMTSRSEYRLILLQDNADMRLTPIGARVGLINPARYDDFLYKKNMIELEIQRIKHTVITPCDEVNCFLEAHGSAKISTGVHLDELLRRPELSYDALSAIDTDRPALPRGVKTTAEIEIKYEGYIRRELAEVEKQRKLESRKLPPDIDYKSITGLRLEAAEKLSLIRPVSIGQASRISGVNPADVSVLLIYLGAARGK